MHPNPIQVVFGLHRDGIEWLVALHERLDSEWDPQLSRAQTIQMYNIIWYIQLFAFWYENHIICFPMLRDMSLPLRHDTTAISSKVAIPIKEPKLLAVRKVWVVSKLYYKT